MRTQLNTWMVKSSFAIAMVTAGNFAAVASTLTLRAGNVVPVSLDNRLSSDHSMQGDRFTATVRSGYLNLPEGTRIEGVVRRAVPKSGNRPGVLVLAFTGMTLENGRHYTIDGTPTNLDPKSVTTKNGRLVAKAGTSNKRLTYVGYGAGAGVLYSVLTGGKNILTNTLLGAGLGYLGGSLEKGSKNQKNNVKLNEGSKMGVLLHKARTVRT